MATQVCHAQENDTTASTLPLLGYSHTETDTVSAALKVIEETDTPIVSQTTPAALNVENVVQTNRHSDISTAALQMLEETEAPGTDTDDSAREIHEAISQEFPISKNDTDTVTAALKILT